VRYVDVNVFVYWLGDDAIFGDEATAIVKGIERGERAATSTITPWLIHVVLRGMGRNYDEEKMVERLEELDFLKMEPLVWEDYRTALKYMHQYRLDLEDALHLAVSQRLGIREMYTNDGDFSRTPAKPVGFKCLTR